jgi:hypothetical protein
MLNEYAVRSLKPQLGEWTKVMATSPEDAAQSYHFDGVGYTASSVKSFTFWNEYEPGRVEQVCFAEIEIEGHGSLISKVYVNGVFRRGGVKAGGPTTLKKIAAELGWTKDPEELLAEWN